MSESKYQAVWFVVPSRILELPGLQLAYLRIFETIFQFLNHGKMCYLSNKSIMERTGILSESTIRECLIFFEKHGELKRTMENGKRYIGLPNISVEIDKVTPVAKSTPPRRQVDAPPVAKSTHNNKNIKYKNNNNKNICSSDDERKHNFDILWNAYPKKRCKQDSLEQWNKTDQSLLPIILEDIKNRLENDHHWQEGNKYIPDLVRYLKKSRWTDEITPKSQEGLANGRPHKETPTERLNRLTGFTKRASEKGSIQGRIIEVDEGAFHQI